MRACGVRAVIARLSAARVTEQRVIPRAFAKTSFLCIPALMPNLSAVNGALSLVLYAKGYGQKFGSTASARRPQGRGRRAHEVRP
ncbi:hypothetical protein PSO31014_04383 [Pandoraea soli]|uniref:Uncharacterized protein n=1 Tax=Pandoraea soli TaxID=2508293 RepID=A0ABY6WAF9_9BURK|nr:hypothetical protein PSO31014_04383 [Pandoraea soli]